MSIMELVNQKNSVEFTKNLVVVTYNRLWRADNKLVTLLHIKVTLLINF